MSDRPDLEKARKLIAAFPEPAREEEQDSVDVARALIALDEQVKAYREALEACVLDLADLVPVVDEYLHDDTTKSAKKTLPFARAVLQRFTEGSQSDVHG